MSSIITNNTQPKYGPRVQAEYVYKHLYEGVPVETIVEKQFPLTIGRAKIYRWISHYNDFGEVPSITYEKEKQLRKRIGSVTNKSINNVVYNTLINIVLEKPSLYLDQVAAELFDRTGYSTSISHISKLLKSKGYTLKKMELHARSASKLDQQRFIDEIHSVPHLSQFVMIDETHKDKKASRKNRAWSKSGKAAILKEHFGPKDFEKYYTMIAAMDIKGFIKESCELIVRPETVDGPRFIKYINDCIVPIMNRYDERNLPRSVITIDNASVHDKLIIEQLLHPTGCRIIYTAAYSPYYHPIERSFHQYKCDIKRQQDTNLDWFGKHLNALNSVTSDNVKNYIKSMWGREEVPNDDNDDDDDMMMMILTGV